MIHSTYVAPALFVIPLAGGLLIASLGSLLKRIRSHLTTLILFGLFGYSVALFSPLLKGTLQPYLLELGGVEVSFAIRGPSLLMVILITFLGALGSLFSDRYMEEYRGEGLSRYYGLLLVFSAAMIAAVLSRELFAMFVFWEIMTVAAFFLIVFERSSTSLRAGIKYFLMSEAGALCMLTGIVILWTTTGVTGLDGLSGVALGPAFRLGVLSLFTIGFGVKAGFFPLHTWLPDAHPAAPSPISALLSGIMIKVGLFWLIRIFWEVFEVSISWHDGLAILGGLTILVGGVLALIQTDIKRLIAYSSISQVGYILMGIGIGTGLGIAGAFLHLVNHALFKGLLFLGAGAVIYRTGTRDMSQMGGLAGEMPIVFGSFLIGSLSLAGVPPLNGFYSKWVLYQAAVDYGPAYSPFLLVAAMFGSTLSVAYIFKALYSAFLGQGNVSDSGGREISWGMRLGVTLPALCCVALGVYPTLLGRFIKPAIGEMPQFMGTWRASLGAGLLLGGIVLGGILYFLVSLKKSARRAPIFTGGETQESMDTAYYFPFTESVDTKVKGSELFNVVRDLPKLKRVFSLHGRLLLDPFELLAWGSKAVSRGIRYVHNGVLSRYLSWVLAGLVILLWLMTGQFW